MSFPAYPYSEWRRWPEEDVREWASEIASEFSLSKFEASALVDEMLSRSGHWSKPAEPAHYPKKMNEELEALYAASFLEWHACSTEENGPEAVAIEIFQQNKRLNRPRDVREPKIAAWEKDRVVGSGLTERVYWKLTYDRVMIQEARTARKKMRKRLVRRPLSVEEERMTNEMREWLWWAGCVEISHDRWLVPDSQKTERDGMWWYYEAVLGRLAMAGRQVKAGEAGRAAWHSLHAGRLFAEMQLKANYDDIFIKARRTRDAQAEGGRSTRKGPKEARQEAWWKYRRDGYASVMAGEMAAEELGVSERTIRRAFDDEYPSMDMSP